MSTLLCRLAEPWSEGPWTGVETSGLDAALVIDAKTLDRQEGVSRFGLRVGYALPGPFANQCAVIERSLVLALEQPGAVSALRLSDLQREAPSPNFVGRPMALGRPMSLLSGRFGVVVEVGADLTQPLFVHVVAQRLVSNHLRVELAPRSR